MQDLHKRLTQTSLIPNWISAWFYKAAHRKVSGLSCSLFRSREGNGEPWLARKSDCIPSDASGISLCIYQGFTRLHGLFAGLRCLLTENPGICIIEKHFSHIAETLEVRPHMQSNSSLLLTPAWSEQISAANEWSCALDDTSVRRNHPGPVGDRRVMHGHQPLIPKGLLRLARAKAPFSLL